MKVTPARISRHCQKVKDEMDNIYKYAVGTVEPNENVI